MTKPKMAGDFDICEEIRFLLDDGQFQLCADIAGVETIHVSGGLSRKRGTWYVTLEMEYSEDLWEWDMGREVHERTANSHLDRLKGAIEGKGLYVNGMATVQNGYYVFDGVEPVEA